MESYITKTVSTTAVTGSETFLYTITAYFADIEESTLYGTIVEYFPNNIQFSLPEIGDFIKDITQTVDEEGGTTVVFDFGTVPTGTSVGFTVSCSFGVGRKNGDTFTNTATLYQNNVLAGEYTSSTVTLTLNADFQLYKYNLTDTNPKVGETVLFRLLLKNNGDLGASIGNVTILDTLPDILVPDLAYTVEAKDVSTTYKDPSQDQTVIWDGSTISLYLESYSGEAYQIDFYAQVDERVPDGTTATNTAYWFIEGAEQGTASADVTTYIDKVEAQLSKYGPTNGTIGGEIQYEISFLNSGTVPLTDFIMTEQVPTDFILEKIACYTLSSQIPTYSIYITTSDTTEETLIFQDMIGNSGIYDLTTYLTEGDKITSVIWRASEVTTAGNTYSFMTLQGYISETASLESSLINTATVTADSTLGSISMTDQQTTTLDNKSVLQLLSGIIDEQSTYYPMDDFYIYLKALGSNGQTESPVFATLLPPELTYLSGNEYYIYYDSFSKSNYDSRDGNLPLSLPSITVTENYNETGFTLVRYSFDDFTLLYNSYLEVRYTVLVSLGATDSFTFTAYLGNPSDDAIVIGTPYQDIYDLDGDGYTEEYIVESPSVSATILYTTAFSIEKFVKGDLNTEYGDSGTVTQGGKAEYQLYITNNQEAELFNIIAIDILPYVGDTGVLLYEEARDSDYPVTLLSAPTTELVNLLTGEVTSTEDVSIAYSLSTDPIRYTFSGEEIGTGEWLDSQPDDITTVRAIRVATDASIILQPYERIIITFPVEAPSAVPEGDIAYNSFAVWADVILTTGEESTLATEPTKVGLVMSEDTDTSIRTFVWDDVNDNGIWDEGEPGVNGVTVELYNSEGTLLETRITADLYTGESGYTLFESLTAGYYQLKFIPEEGDGLTIQNLTAENGSKPDQSTGFTQVFTLSTGEQLTDMNAGLASYYCTYPVIYGENKNIYLNATFDPLTGVTAEDCDGNDLTSSIVVLENTVDTAVAGQYTVTYEVTDQYNQSTEKTITVTVMTDEEARTQAINDLLESIALEETGIKGILDGEGAKIQKAVALDLSTEELLAVNASVNSMVSALAHLEAVLLEKLDFILST